MDLKMNFLQQEDDMDFMPIIHDEIKIYDTNIFKHCKLGLLQQEVTI